MQEVFKERFGELWYKVLQNELNSDWFKKLALFIGHSRQSCTIYPESEDMFRAYKLCPPNNTKIIILSDEPACDGSANGLAFGSKIPFKTDPRKRVIDIIFQEFEDDVKFGMYLDQDVDLGWMAEQGVLLLNSVLSVQRNKPLSHADPVKIGWQSLTGKTIAYLYNERTPKVFMLWGEKNKEFFNRIITKLKLNNNYHLILEAPHPSNDLQYKDLVGDVKPNYPTTFLGCKHFSKANEFLKYNGIKEIIW